METVTENATLRAQVWMLEALMPSSEPSILELGEGRLKFTNRAGPVFDVPVTEVTGMKWPWLQFGYGVDLTVNGQVYRVSFMRPSGAAMLDDNALQTIARQTIVGVQLDSLTGLFQMDGSKKVANQWRAALNAQVPAKA